MKLNKISLGVVAFCGVLSAPAFALPASAIDAGTVKAYLSGATAMDGGVLEAALKFCTTGSLHRYSASNQFVYFCTPDLAKISLPVGTTKLAVHKHSVGGSGNGVQPVNNGTLLPFLDLSLINGSLSCPTPVLATAPSGATFNDSACTTSVGLTSTAVAKVGISDVEPSFFGGSGDFNNLTATALATVIFGVPVTKVVYEALQVKQGLTGTCAGSLVEACMPSLSTPQITSLYTRDASSWAGIAGLTGTFALVNDVTYVARRSATSGTQKTYEALIARTVNSTPSGKSCQVNVAAFVEGPEALDNAAITTGLMCDGNSNAVVNNSGSGQVAFCLNQFQDNGAGAVGTLTTEALTTALGKFRFVKVNGKAPTIANVISGEYTMYSDSSINLRTATMTANDTAFANALKTQFAISPVNQPFGAAGLMTLNSVTGGTTGNPWSRDVVGQVNNCQQARR